MSKEDKFLEDFSKLLRQYDTTIVATAGPENRLCISIYEDDRTFTDLQYEEEINAENVLKEGER
jgi:hypothetical protein